jgi:hypothetical protein
MSAQIPERSPASEPVVREARSSPAHCRESMSWPRWISAAAFALSVAAVVIASLGPRPEPPLAIQVATCARADHPARHRGREAPGGDRGKALVPS